VNINFYNLSNQTMLLLRDSFLPPLSVQHKKILKIVSIVLAGLAACCMISRFCKIVFTKKEYTSMSIDGNATVTFPDGKIYEGNLEKSQLTGYGKKKFPSGTEVVGNFKNNKLNGQGRITYADGSFKEGIFENGVLTAKNKTPSLKIDSPLNPIGDVPSVQEVVHVQKVQDRISPKTSPIYWYCAKDKQPNMRYLQSFLKEFPNPKPILISDPAQVEKGSICFYFDLVNSIYAWETPQETFKMFEEKSGYPAIFVLIQNESEVRVMGEAKKLMDEKYPNVKFITGSFKVKWDLTGMGNNEEVLLEPEKLKNAIQQVTEEIKHQSSSPSDPSQQE
jgi:hypothetical protein